jgi:ribonuclease T1
MTAPLKRAATGDPIPRVYLAELPVEAAMTIELIQAGGPFPFERDGTVFHNFEQRLPAAGDGAYREYTVITPGSDDRGARRIVTDIDRTEFYYTDDHYESFSEIIIP